MIQPRRLDPDRIPDWLATLFEDFEPDPRDTMTLLGGGDWTFPR